MCPAKTAVQCFVADKEALYLAFQNSGSIKYTDFARCWQDMKFSLVLYGRRMRELKEWLPQCYSLVLPDLRQFHPIDRRVFALFLLYGLYFKQPFKEAIPIRANLAVMQDMDELKHYAIREQLVDVLFVWHKLLSSGGIQIVHSASFYGPQFSKSAMKESSTAVGKRMDELRSQLISPLTELTALQSQYETMKKGLAVTIPAVNDLVSSDEVDVLNEQRTRLQSGQLCLPNVAKSPTKSPAPSTATESIGENMRRLKNRRK